MKKDKYFYLRILFACGLLLFLFSKADWQHVLEILGDIQGVHLAYTSIWVVLIRVFMTWRWQILLRFRQIHLSFTHLLKITWVSMFLGHFFPGGIGPDVVRGYSLYKNGQCAAEVTGSLIWDRIFGVYSMILLASIALWVAKHTDVVIPAEIVYGTHIIFIVTTLALLCWPAIMRSKWVVSLETRKNGFMQKWIRPFKEPVSIMGIMLPSLGLSVLVQIFRCLLFYSLYRSFSADISFSFFLVVIPIVYMVVLIPVSISGLGVRESTLIFFFSFQGQSAEVSLTVGLMSHVLQMILSLPGCLFWLTDGKEKTHESD